MCDTDPLVLNELGVVYFRQAGTPRRSSASTRHCSCAVASPCG